MKTSVLILGRQPAISLAELESIYGSGSIEVLNGQSVLLNVPTSDVDLKSLGGSIKLCQPIITMPNTNWQAISEFLYENIASFLENTDGKIKLGLSIYGSSINPHKINIAGLKLKKYIKQTLQRSIRTVPNTDSYLSSAQVIHNNLTKTNGAEIVICIGKNRTTFSKTIQVQDIFAYAKRDQNRPARDAKVGMLPPKLAQIIINLAIGNQKPKVVLDPFCGTGVILQETFLKNLTPYGTDLNEKMISYAIKNIDWLIKSDNSFKIHQADATTFKWDSFDTLASETYLGRPFSTEPNQDKLNLVIQDVNTILKKFLKNLSSQTKPGLRLCIAVPVWFTKRGPKRLPIIDQLSILGYTQVSFVYANNNDLIYHRENQIVGRELLVLIRKNK